MEPEAKGRSDNMKRKRIKIIHTSTSDMDDVGDETTEVIALSRSTVVLSRRRKRIAIERKSIPDEADAIIAERRCDLLKMMEQLEIEKNNQHIEKRDAEVVADKRDQAMLNMKDVVSSDAYCIDCGLFYRNYDRSKNGCIPCPHCSATGSLAKYSGE